MIPLDEIKEACPEVEQLCSDSIIEAEDGTLWREQTCLSLEEKTKYVLRLPDRESVSQKRLRVLRRNLYWPPGELTYVDTDTFLPTY